MADSHSSAQQAIQGLLELEAPRPKRVLPDGLLQGVKGDVLNEDFYPGVYFLKCRDVLKIGRSAVPRKRLRQLAQGIPFPVEILAYVPCGYFDSQKLEAECHRRFRALLASGREWFRFESPLVEYVATLPKPDFDL